MKTKKFNKILNYIMAAILITLWGCILFIHGVTGSIAWAVTKLYFAPIGIILLLISVVILIISLIKKKKITQKIISLILSIFLALPILMLFNIFKVEYPANINKIMPSITIIWPLNEKTTVGWGGDSINTNIPHAIWSSERWAYDLVMDPANMNSKNLKDYGIYDKDVVAPVSGTIVDAYDDENDIPPNTEDFLSMEGNHVYIKIDKTGTFLLLNHLKKGSVSVKVGDHVKEGQVIGKVGNSGSTSEPHLHIHHQRQDPTKTLHPTFAEGLPLYFKDINGKPMPEKGSVIIPKK
ncbi:M23 family metallopeptidase [Clostridium sporogenes]|uniref:M23 family metallopeptidase n=1 Tax=Clostridium sporogenes TaxID=1509 RepID=UPI0013F12E99|nr:M23 family metallopeptidase [Clostridium sporogenes]NFP90599.1 M23 family metallopeptidase [Clostridium sporogenes]